MFLHYSKHSYYANTVKTKIMALRGILNGKTKIHFTTLDGMRADTSNGNYHQGINY